jgi:hypothetical protein
MKGAQIGGTECGNNWMGYIIHHAIALPKCARRYACLSLAIGGFGPAAGPSVPDCRRTVRHGFYRIRATSVGRYPASTCVTRARIASPV